MFIYQKFQGYGDERVKNPYNHKIYVGRGGGVDAAKFFFLETLQGLEMMSIMIKVCSYLIYEICFKKWPPF